MIGFVLMMNKTQQIRSNIRVHIQLVFEQFYSLEDEQNIFIDIPIG